MALKLLKNFAPNIVVQEPEKKMEYEDNLPTAEEMEKLNMKCRDILMEQVYEKIDKHKIQAMNQLGKNRLEDP